MSFDPDDYQDINPMIASARTRPSRASYGVSPQMQQPQQQQQAQPGTSAAWADLQERVRSQFSNVGHDYDDPRVIAAVMDRACYEGISVRALVKGMCPSGRA